MKKELTDSERKLNGLFCHFKSSKQRLKEARAELKKAQAYVAFCKDAINSELKESCK